MPNRRVFVIHGGFAGAALLPSPGVKPGTMRLYSAASDLAAAHKDLGLKGAEVNEVNDDLFGVQAAISTVLQACGGHRYTWTLTQ